MAYRRCSLILLACTLLLCGGEPALVAQQMEHMAPSAPSTRLTLHTYDGKSLTLTPEEFAGLPHKSVTVFNAHTKVNETYSGVPVVDLLSKVGVPLGESVRGKLFMIGIVAGGMDGYSVLYSLGEVDPSIHTGDVMVADMLDGQKIAKDGAFKMVATEEKRPARWVRNLTTISVIKVEP